MPQKLVCIFAHPDDEAFGPSGTIAKYAAEGEVYLICVTNGNDKTNGFKQDLSEKRKKELFKSSEILGIKRVYCLEYEDGTLCNGIYHEVSQKIEKILKSLKPDTLLTFELRGASGHIDHVFCAMVASFLFEKLEFIKRILYFATPVQISKSMKDYFIYFPEGFKEDQVDITVDVSQFWNTKIKAINAHLSQTKDRKRAIKVMKSAPLKEYFFVSEK